LAKINRRDFMALGAATAGASFPAAANPTSPAAFATQLKADGLPNPLGLETPPRLSWRMRASGRKRRQTAYRIGAATTRAAAEAERFDLWDSGRIASASGLDIAYAGPGLKSGAQAFWRVQLWDDSGWPSAFSEVASWEMGLVSPDNWTGVWINADDPVVAEERAEGMRWIWGAEAATAQNRKFRWSFHLDPAHAASLVLCAKDELRGLWLDGDTLLKPGQRTAWGMGPEFPLVGLGAGDHLLAVEVGIRLDEARPFIGGALAAVLRLTAPSGAVARLHSGPQWRTSLADTANWHLPLFDDSAWPVARPAAIIPECHPWPAAAPVQLRREFAISKPIVRARLRATAMGAYEMMLNGKRVGDALLTPESTDYRRRTLCQTYDVTRLVASGSNVLGATVADGYFASPFGFLDLRYTFGDPPRRLLAQLELTYADGETEVVGSDSLWRLSPSPLVKSEIYDGETYDARREQPGWDHAGFDAASWQAVRLSSVPFRPTAQVAYPIRRTQQLPALAITSPADGIYIYDFGQNFAGWCRLAITGPRGTIVRLRYGEALDDTGHLNVKSNRRALNTDCYILRGDPAGESWEPRFTYHGFRYVEVTGLPQKPGLDLLSGLVVHSDLPLTGHVRCSDQTVENLWRNTLWSQRSNFYGIPTDCPQRDERMGWNGDAQIFSDAAAFNMDVEAFTRRFLGDIRAAQTPEGDAPDIAPYWTLGQNTPGWADAMVILPWTSWRRYGATAIIDENWQAMTRWSARLESQNPDHVWRVNRGLDYGDWLSVDSKDRSDITTPKELISTGYWAYSTGLMAQMARATGRHAEATRLDALREAIVASFQRLFVRPDGGVGNDSQTSHILALKFGLLPKGLRSASAARLAADVQRRGVHLSTGFLGTPYILDSLADNGHEDLAVALLLQTTPPSWGTMANGGTTMWERWDGFKDGVVTGSLNHYAFGAVNGFIYRRLAGIDALEPGFKRIAIRPLLTPRLAAVSADYESAMGRGA